MQSSSRLLELPSTSFDPWRVSELRHHLSDHPLFAKPALMGLAGRLEQRRSVRAHTDQATAGTAFNHAPAIFPNRRTAVATLDDIDNAGVWMSLLNVQADEIYRELVDEVLENVKPMVDTVDPGMCYRGGWIFLTSPRAVTPFHMDKEHNFILQIQGRKTLYVWEPDDLEAVSEEARDLFHASHSRDLVAWRDALRARAHVFHLEPGMGAYMPATSPHMVENGDGASITASFTYYTHSTIRNARLHALHHRLRQMGMRPARVGAHPWWDAVSGTLYSGLLGLQRALGPGRGPAGVGGEYTRYALDPAAREGAHASI